MCASSAIPQPGLFTPKGQQPQAGHLQGTFCSPLPFIINPDTRPVGLSFVSLHKTLLSCQGSSQALHWEMMESWNALGWDLKFWFQPPATGREPSTKPGCSGCKPKTNSCGAGFAFVIPGSAATLGILVLTSLTLPQTGADLSNHRSR